MIRTIFPSATAGPAAHARTLLKPGETLLWATFAKGITTEKRGMGAVPGKLASAGRKTLDGFASLFEDREDSFNNTPPPPDVIIFWQKETDYALQYGGRLQPIPHSLFMLTSARMHVAMLDPHPDDLQPEPAPQPTPTSTRKSKFAAFVDDMVATGKEIAAAVTTPETKPKRKTVSLHHLRPLIDIPRAQIANFEVESDGVARKVYYLRMELTDRSGFEFFCGAVREREQYERMLALTFGAPE
ncbi:hypothetical protein ALI144C_24675 [Actinosynnema sp. ALI-1.44]|uniref:hypothetical protein n=1 Tax=Actinosynnema sp. ALI-1.44 TaxID=1933779 RepID=UPI00097C31FA|nr:hypothetical protein [Actinosynnema sp. ALI-1.44]ONI79926.1 hypothetical protein ALI144C_24675 [Actinosynnema sp. ALI-1.44]